MQRIYGYAFFTKEELDQHLHRLEEAKRRDHRKLGRELDLFSIADETGRRARALAPEGRLHPQADRGLLARRALRGRLRHRLHPAHRQARPVEDERPPRLLPGEHVLADRDRERRVPAQADELPVPPARSTSRGCAATATCRIRWAELGTVYRFERSGVLHGLMRVRGFTQDDAHVFCRPDQLEDEILRVLDFTTNILRTFGFDRYDIYLSTRPEKSTGTDEQWEAATAALKKALETRGLAVHRGRGRGRLLRAEDRHQDQGLARARLAVLDDPGRLQPARALRARVHRRGRQGAPAGHGAPRAARQPRALLRRADRALRGRLPALARAGAGRGDPGDREAAGLRARGGRGAASAGRAGPGGRPQREAGLPDPRGPAAEGPLHAGGGGQGSRGEDGLRAPPPGRRPRRAGRGRPSAARVVDAHARARDPRGRQGSVCEEVSHRQQDGPHQRPHPGQGSPGDRRGRRPARHHAARAGADACGGEGARPRRDRGHGDTRRCAGS